jgi:hypothetical protein
MDMALSVAAKLAALNISCSFFEDRIRYHSSNRMMQELERQPSENAAALWVPTSGRSAWKIITDMLALEEDGATYSFESLAPSVLEWVRRVLKCENGAVVQKMYPGSFWEGGSKRKFQENSGQVESAWPSSGTKV